jgi:hypothetical protein
MIMILPVQLSLSSRAALPPITFVRCAGVMPI